MTLLSELDLRNALANRLRDWTLKEDRLERSFEFPSFNLAMQFVNRVADIAEEMQHHPDMTIEYNKVKVSTTSHDAGGITFRDVNLAGKIQEIAPQLSNVGRLRTA